jgi:hypothetical protein
MTAMSVREARQRLSSTKIHCLLYDQGLFERIGLKENSSEAHSNSPAQKTRDPLTSSRSAQRLRPIIKLLRHYCR